MLFLFAALGAASSTGVVPVNLKTVLLVIILCFWYVNATSLNDLADEKIDEINLQGAKGRPLIRKTSTRAYLYRIYIISGVVAVAGSFLFSLKYGLIMLGAIVLNNLYSMPPIRISYRGIFAPLLLPIGYVVVPFIGGSLLAGGATDIKLLIAFYVAFCGRIILKDFRDIKGDTRYGKKTFVVRHGKNMTCLVSSLFWLAGDVFILVAVADKKLWVLLQPLLLLIMLALAQLRQTTNFKFEQVYIGLLARAANGLLITLLAYFLLITNSQGPYAAVVIIVSLFSVLHIISMLEPEHIVIGYRG
jgi:4-hydroxybenzoate polyprenyltransferase